jgi:hypothetical protein
MDLKNNLNSQEIEKRIFTFRGQQIMVDKDLAELYGVSTKRINEQVKRNQVRFPAQFCFQLDKNEKDELVANCDRFKNLKHSSSLPNAFTEQGVAMLSAILRSEMAVHVSISIIEAFVSMRRTIQNFAPLFHKLEKIESKQIESDQKFEKIFKALEKHSGIPEKGIFFDGEVFDAYHFVSEIIREVEKEIILIDNYIDDSVLMLLSKRRQGAKAIIYTKNISKIISQDLEKHNQQYPPIEIKEFHKSHDRFLIIDKTKVFLIGASLKDLGKKWFGFSQMNMESLKNLKRIK